MKNLALGHKAILLAAMGMALASAPAAAQSEGQALHVFVGKSVVINLQAPVTRILSSNPAIIDTLATSPTQIVVEGKTAGSSSLILWDAAGHSQMLDVTVDVNVASLRATLEQAFPGEQINIQSDGAHLILTGTVSDAKVADTVVKMASAYSGAVVNSLVVEPLHQEQILLEVKFAEVDRTKLQQLGFNFLSGAGNTLAGINTQQFSPGNMTGTVTTPTGTQGTVNVTDMLNIFAIRPDLNLAATIRDLEGKSVLQILAEPNLLALNGQKASFLAGGEFPVPVVQGGQNVGVVTIQFRPFGVRLEFTAYIGKDRIIRLHVQPEVSTLDFSNAAIISGFTVPAMSTRRAETEIELKDGQSFGIAGLLDNRAQVTLSKVPGISDIPVLGALFRSRNISRNNSELVVMVTPRVVDPVKLNSPPPALPKNPVKFLETPQFDRHMPMSAPNTSGETGNQQPPSAK